MQLLEHPIELFRAILSEAMLIRTLERALRLSLVNNKWPNDRT